MYTCVFATKQILYVYVWPQKSEGIITKGPFTASSVELYLAMSSRNFRGQWLLA